MDFKRSDKNISSVFNVGWIVFLIMFGLIILSVTVSMNYLLILFAGYIGALERKKGSIKLNTIKI